MSQLIDDVVDGFQGEIAAWYEGERRNGDVNSNVMALAVVMLDHLEKRYPLTENDYSTGKQVRRISGARVLRVLILHGETRPFTREGGRTSRGTLPLAHQLVERLNNCAAGGHYGALDEGQRAAVKFELQAWLVERIRADYLDKKLIEASDINVYMSSWAIVSALLGAARLRAGNASGAFAQHLVGATLSLRFPDVLITNESYTTADRQTSRQGDFEVSDAAFHVTMSPGESLFSSRCKDNIAHGYRPVVVVPANRVVVAEALAKDYGREGGVTIRSIEDFVSASVDESSGYESKHVRKTLRQLLERYNERVRAVESDPSLQVKIPKNL